MFQRFHEMKERREAGFTLIELLVVILIIAILAAIAIPVFLSQRRKGWTSQVQSALKNAATAEESFATANNGTYTTALTGPNSLESEGLRYSNVTLATPVLSGTPATSFCLEGTSDNDTTIIWSYDSQVGQPQEGALC